MGKTIDIDVLDSGGDSLYVSERKVYPRDSPTPGGGESDTQTHRILRRGIPFGTSFRPSLGATGHGGKFGVEEPRDRGLLFLCYQSSLARQFEFLQRVWVNNPTFPESATQDEALPEGEQDGQDRPAHRDDGRVEDPSQHGEAGDQRLHVRQRQHPGEQGEVGREDLLLGLERSERHVEVGHNLDRDAGEQHEVLDAGIDGDA